MLILPVSGSYAQDCTFLGYQCAYNSGGYCNTCEMNYAVYECTGMFYYQEYGCCTINGGFCNG